MEWRDSGQGIKQIKMGFASLLSQRNDQSGEHIRTQCFRSHGSVLFGHSILISLFDRESTGNGSYLRGGWTELAFRKLTSAHHLRAIFARLNINVTRRFIYYWGCLHVNEGKLLN